MMGWWGSRVVGGSWSEGSQEEVGSRVGFNLCR